jgi:hypothetical protein
MRYSELCEDVPSTNPTFSPAFKAWFDGSAVVDSDGNPLRVYHGTIRDFPEFQYIKPTGIGGAGWGFNRIGFWFDADPRTPGRFADSARGGGNVMPVYLAIKHPLIISRASVSPAALARVKKLRDEWLQLAKQRESGDTSAEYRYHAAERAYDIAKKELERNDPFAQLMDILPKYNPKAPPEKRAGHTDRVARVQRKLIKQGYDGILLRNTLADMGSRDTTETDWWIAFHPNQIKSAIGNRGTYNPKDPRISESNQNGKRAY